MEFQSRWRSALNFFFFFKPFLPRDEMLCAIVIHICTSYVAKGFLASNLNLVVVDKSIVSSITKINYM